MFTFYTDYAYTKDLHKKFTLVRQMHNNPFGGTEIFL